jgi:hypothetical protein
MPLMFGMLRNIVPSLPLFVSPQHWFAGNGGLPRVVYLAEVCLTQPLRDPDLDLLALDLLALVALAALAALVALAALAALAALCLLDLDRPFDRVLGILPFFCPLCNHFFFYSEEGFFFYARKKKRQKNKNKKLSSDRVSARCKHKTPSSTKKGAGI